MALCDVAIGNEEDADKVFGIAAQNADVKSGVVEAEQYASVCQQLAERFPRLSTIAITLRGSLSASHNTWRWGTDPICSPSIQFFINTIIF